MGCFIIFYNFQSHFTQYFHAVHMLDPSQLHMVIRGYYCKPLTTDPRMKEKFDLNPKTSAEKKGILSFVTKGFDRFFKNNVHFIFFSDTKSIVR